MVPNDSIVYSHCDPIFITHYDNYAWIILQSLKHSQTVEIICVHMCSAGPHPPETYMSSAVSSNENDTLSIFLLSYFINQIFVIA